MNLPQNDVSLQSGLRPCVIMQDERATKNDRFVWVLPLTSKHKAMHLPTHLLIRRNAINGLKVDSVAESESLVKINKKDLIKKIGILSKSEFVSIGKTLCEQFPMLKFALNYLIAL